MRNLMALGLFFSSMIAAAPVYAANNCVVQISGELSDWSVVSSCNGNALKTIGMGIDSEAQAMSAAISKMSEYGYTLSTCTKLQGSFCIFVMP